MHSDSIMHRPTNSIAFLVQKVEPSDSAGPLQPNLALRYSTHKNLANIASQEGNWETAIENYLQVGIFGIYAAVLTVQTCGVIVQFCNYTSWQQCLKCN